MKYDIIGLKAGSIGYKSENLSCYRISRQTSTESDFIGDDL